MVKTICSLQGGEEALGAVLSTPGLNKGHSKYAKTAAPYYLKALVLQNGTNLDHFEAD